MNPMDMNKIDIVQPTPRKACECFGATCSYCKHEAPHRSSIQLDWLTKDWDSEKAKAGEHKSLIYFDPPKQDSDKQTLDLETEERKVVSADDLPIQNLSIHQDKLEEESPEASDAVVPPQEALAATPATDVAKLEDIMEESSGGLTEQEQRLQREEDKYAIYIGMLSDEEERDTETDMDESIYPFYN